MNKYKILEILGSGGSANVYKLANIINKKVTEK